MSLNQWWAGLGTLKKEAEEAPCPDSLGLDLIKGEPLLGRDILNYSHLQVFGKDQFLRNMLQRVLVQDVDRKIPVIAIALTRESELPKEFYKVFVDKKPEESERFFHYEAHQKESSPPLFNRAEFFQFGKRQFIYVRFGAESAARDRSFLSTIEEEIKIRFNRIDRLSPDAKRPAIYIFLPEKIEPSHRITQYVESLSCYTAFRIFSKELQILDRDVSSLVYGPELYPEKDYEEMRKHCYWQFHRKKAREGGPGLFSFLRAPEKFKLVKRFSKGIPFHQTAFGCFKINETTNEYVWFYPVQQSLGKENYGQMHQNDEPENQRAVPVKKKLPTEDPLIRQIFEDLKPKNEDSKKELC
ncbi:MAG TPA: hypothetical protein DIS66_02040 [Candidatus Omnitrophica bacterium]|nr:hypothetical protein [Candidatus Omnitrophota bacterium]